MRHNPARLTAFLIPLPSPHHLKPVNLVQFISNLFINTMGITKPSPQAEKRAARYIVILLAAVVTVVALLTAVAIHFAVRH